MDARLNRTSLLFGIPGVLIQIAAPVFSYFVLPGNSSFPETMAGVGTILLLIGLGYYAKAKGRSAWWCLLGFLSIIGLIILACLEDRSGTTPRPLP